jgi:hypothetical protein
MRKTKHTFTQKMQQAEAAFKKPISAFGFETQTQRDFLKNK